MKKKQLETLEKMNKDRNLDKETIEKILKKILKNFLIAIGILLFFIILKFVSINLEKQIAILIYKILSFGLLAFTIILFELAYKKDDDNIAIISIEIFFLTIITLLTPYILISRTNSYTSSIGVVFAVYYSIKNYVIYIKAKNEYLKEKSDITQIVKKESKDELVKELLIKEKQENLEQPKRKRGRPRKVVNN